jgi:hypothetical protein
MTTSLLQRPTTQLELLLWSRQFRKRGLMKWLRFLSRMRSLRDAKTPELTT